MAARKPDPFAFLVGADGDSSILHMGLTPVTDADWVEPFTAEIYTRFYRHKQALLQQDPGAILVDPHAEAALQELSVALQQHLQQDHSQSVEENRISLNLPDTATAEDLLRTMALWLPDDICLLQSAFHQDEYVLTAASVLSPSLWQPAAKFLRPLAEIHAPIPNMQGRLLPSVHRFIRHIKAGSPVVRFNWAIQVGDGLSRLPGRAVAVDESSVLYYRYERQTLLRLPASQAVVFLIRTHICELSRFAEIEGDRTTLPHLLDYIDRLPTAEREYKGLGALESALRKYRT